MQAAIIICKQMANIRIRVVNEALDMNQLQNHDDCARYRFNFAIL